MLDILVQHRRDKQAAKKFFCELLKGLTYVPRVIVTDKLKSYGHDSSSGERSRPQFWPHRTRAEPILLSLCPGLALSLRS